MCEADAYVHENGNERLVLKSVDLVEPVEGGFRLVNIFGDQRVVRGRIRAMHLVDHRIVFEPVAGDARG